MKKYFMIAVLCFATLSITSPASAKSERSSGAAYDNPRCVAAADKAAPPHSGSTAIRQKAYDDCIAKSVPKRQK